MAESLREMIGKLTSSATQIAMKKYAKDKKFTHDEVAFIVTNALNIYKESLADLIKTLPMVTKNGKNIN